MSTLEVVVLLICGFLTFVMPPLLTLIIEVKTNCKVNRHGHGDG
jgi:hypothetical protein